MTSFLQLLITNHYGKVLENYISQNDNIKQFNSTTSGKLNVHRIAQLLNGNTFKYLSGAYTPSFHPVADLIIQLFRYAQTSNIDQVQQSYRIQDEMMYFCFRNRLHNQVFEFSFMKLCPYNHFFLTFLRFPQFVFVFNKKVFKNIDDYILFGVPSL